MRRPVKPIGKLLLQKAYEAAPGNRGRQSANRNRQPERKKQARVLRKKTSPVRHTDYARPLISPPPACPPREEQPMLSEYEAATLVKQNTAGPAPTRATRVQNRIGTVLVVLSVISAVGLLYTAF